MRRYVIHKRGVSTTSSHCRLCARAMPRRRCRSSRKHLHAIAATQTNCVVCIAEITKVSEGLPGSEGFAGHVIVSGEWRALEVSSKLRQTRSIEIMSENEKRV